MKSKAKSCFQITWDVGRGRARDGLDVAILTQLHLCAAHACLKVTRKCHCINKSAMQIEMRDSSTSARHSMFKSPVEHLCTPLVTSTRVKSTTHLVLQKVGGWLVADRKEQSIHLHVCDLS